MKIQNTVARKYGVPRLAITCSLLAASLTLTGCGGAYWNAVHDGKPKVATYDVSAQSMLASAKHWRIVADDVASQISKIAKPTDSKIFVPDAKDPSSQFSRVFASQLKSSLFSAGVNLASTDSSAHKVVVKVDAVKFVDAKKYAPGSLTTLGAGVAVVRNLAVVHGDGGASIAAAIIGSDVGMSILSDEKRPLTEIVLTTSIEQNGKYVLHSTDTYYVEGGDICLYKEPEGIYYNFTGNGKTPDCGYYFKK